MYNLTKLTWPCGVSASIAAVVLVALLSQTTQAGVITRNLITSETDLINTGFGVIDAANFGGTGTATVNGITHANDNGNYSPINFSGGFGDPNGGVFTGDLFNLLDGITGTTNANEPATFSVGGLTPGQDYLLQSYWIVKDNFATRKMNVNFEGDVLNNIDANANTSEAVLISYTFTAGDDTFNASINASGGDNNTWLTGYSLQNAQAAPLQVTNGGFENPDLSSNQQVQNITDWFDDTTNFRAWHQGEGRIINDPPTYSNSQHAAFGPFSFIYQSLGQKNEGDGSLEWEFTQGTFTDNNASTGFLLEFYAGDGVFTGADGVDIASAGLQLLDSFSFNSMNAEGILSRINTGTLDLLGVADGTEIWLRLASTDNGFAPVDDIQVRVLAAPVPEPTTAALAMLGVAGLLTRRRKAA